MGLIEINEGNKVIVSRIEGGRGIRRKIMDLGIFPGVPITVIRKSQRCPTVIEVMGRKVIIGQGMAAKIYVC